MEGQGEVVSGLVYEPPKRHVGLAPRRRAPVEQLPLHDRPGWLPFELCYMGQVDDVLRVEDLHDPALSLCYEIEIPPGTRRDPVVPADDRKPAALRKACCFQAQPEPAQVALGPRPMGANTPVPHCVQQRSAAAMPTPSSITAT